MTKKVQKLQKTLLNGPAGGGPPRDTKAAAKAAAKVAKVGARTWASTTRVEK